MKRGTLYAVGVGPGKAGHLTLLAAETLRACPVIAAPRTGGGHMLALEIAQPVPGEGGFGQYQLAGRL